MAINILIHSSIAATVAIICLLENWLIPGFAFAILAFGLVTVWVNTAYLRSSGVGSTPPRWLAKLERLRQHLANEGEEPRTTTPAQR